MSFHVAPKVIFTDSDNAIMASAIRNALPQTKHLLCTWHLSLNFNTNVHPAMKKNEFDAMANIWWKICKNSDILSVEKFDEEWQRLQDMVPLPPKEEHEKYAKYETAMTWLKKCYDNRMQWAARWCWSSMTAGAIEFSFYRIWAYFRILNYYWFHVLFSGVHSTQRSESQHSAIKTKIKASSLNV